MPVRCVGSPGDGMDARKHSPPWGAGILAALLALGIPGNAFAADEIHWTVTGQTSVSFDWRGPESLICYGPTGAYDRCAVAQTPSPLPFSSNGPFWEAWITGLQENTLYHYSIGGGTDHTFRTPPPRGGSCFTVYAEGDVGDSTSSSKMAVLQAQIASGLPDFVLGVGDLTYGGSHGQATVDQHFNDVMVWARDAAYMPAWGNNEWDHPTNVCGLTCGLSCATQICDDLRNYKGRFDLPNAQSSPGSPQASCCGDDWYWFDYGDVRFIAYPEPWSGALSDWNTMARAVMDAAQADPAIRSIVTWGHRPAYSSGHHPGELTLQGFLDALGAGHSKYVLNLNAHSHNYERSYPQSGVVHVTVDTGGAGLEEDLPCLWRTCIQPSWSAFRAMHLGTTRLRFTPTGIEGTFICGPAGGGINDITCAQGSIVDRFTLGSISADDATCDGADDDCDGIADEDYVPVPTTCGVGACASIGATACAAGAVADSCAPRTPAASDATCDGVDDDCDGTADENYVPLPTSCGVGACATTGATTCVGGVVVDTCRPGTFAASDATCDGVDDDCDGTVDDDYVPVPTSCGVGACAATGATTCVGGIVVDSCRAGTPAAGDGVCNGSDDDCDGAIDEDYVPVPTACGLGACIATGATSCVGGSVQDSCAPRSPAAGDATCDGVDDDCDGMADEDYVPVPTSCGVGACAAAGATACVNGGVLDTCNANAASLITDPARVFAVPQTGKPSYLSPVTEPTFHTTLTRIAGDPGQPLSWAGPSSGTGTWGNDARHHYAKDQPWNSDGTLLVLQNDGAPDPLILDGDTYQVKYGKCGNYSLGDDRWHPSRRHASERINARGSELMWFDVVSCTKTRSWILPFSVDGFGSGEGNPSSDGRYAVLGDATRIFVVDMDPQPPDAPYPSSRIGPACDVSGCGLSTGCSIDWVSISPSGRYAVVVYRGDHPRVLDVDPRTLALSPRPMPPTSPRCAGDPAQGYLYDVGHQDMTLNPFDNGEDVVIGQEHCGNRGGTVDGQLIGGVVMVRLRDGAITSLTDPTDEAYPHHISTRNYDRPGWVYVGYYPESGARFGDEIVAVKMDGSGTVERLAHQHSDFDGCYRCEPHAVPSRDGRRALFASNWAEDCVSGCGSLSDIKAYVVDERSGGTPPSADDATCDGVDDDCDGATDEDYVPAATECGSGVCASSGTTSCVGGTVVDGCVPSPPGTPEICDSIDNDCDGLVDEDFGPGDPCVVDQGGCQALGVMVCAVDRSASVCDTNDIILLADPLDTDTLLSWHPPVALPGYDLVRGNLDALHDSLGDFTVATDSCTSNDLVANSVLDADVPAAGHGYWYAIRGNQCAGGSYDSIGEGLVGLRNDEINASPSSCP